MLLHRDSVIPVGKQKTQYSLGTKTASGNTAFWDSFPGTISLHNIHPFVVAGCPPRFVATSRNQPQPATIPSLAEVHHHHDHKKGTASFFC
jgi:hypothetical protein